jgi:septal ring factor EnvC (AmiA/AmiB activator)
MVVDRYIFPILSIYCYRKGGIYMARGQRKTVEEKIQAKQELIDALLTRVESEKRELAELLEEKKRRELETVSEMIGDYGLAPEEVAQAIQQFLDSRQEAAS